jgi:glutamate synthase (ferredoxin)
MSGGIAYVLDERGDFPAQVNRQMVNLETLDDPEEADAVRAMIARHQEYTGSSRARAVLANWPAMCKRFVKVIPKDYQRVLAGIRRAHEQGLTGDEAVMAAFEENARDLARVGGN